MNLQAAEKAFPHLDLFVETAFSKTSNEKDALEILVQGTETLLTTIATNSNNQGIEALGQALISNVKKRMTHVQAIKAYAAEKEIEIPRFFSALSAVHQFLSNNDIQITEHELVLDNGDIITIFFEEERWQAMLVMDADYSKPINLNLPKFL